MTSRLTRGTSKVSVTTETLIDTGPLVAFLLEAETHHPWVKGVMATLRPPLWTVEPVITEACFLLRRIRGGERAVLELLTSGLVRIGLSLSAEARAISPLMVRYANVPMSLADGGLVRLSELRPRSRVLTLDRDFLVYRRNGRQRIPLLAPWG